MISVIDFEYLESGKLVKVRPEDAQVLLTERSYTKQRSIKPGSLGLIKAMMPSKAWRGGELIHFAWEGEKCVLINGQHRMMAQIELDITTTYRLFVYPKDKSIYEAYAEVDSIVAKRTNEDIVRQYGLGGELSGYDVNRNRLMADIGRALLRIIKRTSGRPASVTLTEFSFLRLRNAWEQYKDTIAKVVNIMDSADLSSRDDARIQRAGLLGIILYSIHVGGDRYTELWGDILNNRGEYNMFMARCIMQGRYRVVALESAALYLLTKFDLGEIPTKYTKPILVPGKVLEWRDWRFKTPKVLTQTGL